MRLKDHNIIHLYKLHHEVDVSHIEPLAIMQYAHLLLDDHRL